VVRPLEAEQTTASGLVIPDTAKEKPRRAKSSRWARDASTTRVPARADRLKVGDVVLYSKYGGPR